MKAATGPAAKPGLLAELRKVATANTLRSCQMFGGLPAPDLEEIAAVTVVELLDKDEYPFHEGDSARGLYIVQCGSVNVHRWENRQPAVRHFPLLPPRSVRGQERCRANGCAFGGGLL